MTIDRYELVDRFGRATDAGVGALFVGAGLSIGAGPLSGQRPPSAPGPTTDDPTPACSNQHAT